MQTTQLFSVENSSDCLMIAPITAIHLGPFNLVYMCLMHEYMSDMICLYVYVLHIAIKYMYTLDIMGILIRGYRKSYLPSNHLLYFQMVPSKSQISCACICVSVKIWAWANDVYIQDSFLTNYRRIDNKHVNMSMETNHLAS